MNEPNEQELKSTPEDNFELKIIEKLFPGQTWDNESDNASSSESNSGSGSVSLSSFSESNSNSNSESDSSGSHSFSGSSTSSMERMQKHKKKRMKDEEDEFLSGNIKEVIRDFELDVFIIVVVTGKEELNLIITDKTLILMGENPGTLEEVTKNKSIDFIIGKDATVAVLRITGGTSNGNVVKIKDNVLVFEPIPKKKSLTNTK